MNKAYIRIILADDDAGDRLLFKEALEELAIEYDLQMVTNGVLLMEHLGLKDIVLPHLVFVDLNMPRKNGFECLKEIKGNTLFDEISVFAYSTSNSERDIQEAFRCGADAYINKPGDFGVLKQLLGKAIASRESYRDPCFRQAHFTLHAAGSKPSGTGAFDKISKK